MMKNVNRLGLDGEGSNDENYGYQTNENGFSGADMSMSGNGTNGGGYSNKTAGDNGSKAVTPDEASPMDVDENDSMKREGGGVSSSSKITNNIQGEIKAEKNTGDRSGSAAPVIAAPVPLLKGILTYIDNDLARKHTITGMWNFESSTESQPQTFQLTRNLGKDEDPKDLPKDGEFQGSFRVSYTHIGSNGKTKSRTRVIPESGVKLAFTKQEGKEDSFDIKGVGTNQYGVFDIYGNAERDELEQNKAYKVELRKKYIATPDAGSANMPPMSTKKNKSKSKKRKLASASAPAEKHEGPLPDPSPSYPSGVVCLRGKVTRDSTVQDGVVHHISGHWASGLELIQSDPKGERGICNEFEYEHRSTVGTEVFPISGRYTGWFNFAENGKKTRYTDRDVVLKFKKNNAGYYNVEGRGSNNFGKYNITGAFDKDHIITLFRHFVPLKVKKIATTPTSTSTSSSQHDGQQSKSATMTLDDVEVPDQTFYEPIKTPSDGQYQAISRGILKLSDDGSHICTGKWAQSRSLHTTNVTSNFTFGLDEHHAKSAIEDTQKNGLIESDQSNPFPLDSANYKGSFKMKKGTAQPVVDQQIVMKFRKNTSGSYNVYGKGVNVYGTFDLVGIFVKLGPHSGNVELFRIYQPAPEVTPASTSASAHPKAKLLPLAKNAPAKKGAAGKSIDTISSGHGNLMRRESSRQSKLPSHLADDDPAAQNTRLMDKCTAILKLIQEKDSKGGRYFLEPVDPVAHNIPTYHEIIANPMDLGTIAIKMEANEIDSPAEFARLVRLVFENAVTFNTNPMNYVHQSARDLLSLFNQKFRDVERLMKKPTKAELKEMKRKNQKEEKKRLEKDKKRKREDDDQDPKLKHLALLQSSAEDSKRSLDVLSSATYATSNQVSRNEFNMMADALENVNTQMQHMTILIQQLISPATAKPEMAASNTSIFEATEANANKKPKKTKKQTKTPAKQEQEPAEIPVALAPPAPAADPAPLEDEEPLTHEEQEELTSAINEMAEDSTKIMKVIDIIKKSKQSSELIDDDQEIELDLDQLDTATQRKLLKFAMKVRIENCTLFLILFQR